MGISLWTGKELIGENALTRISWYSVDFMLWAPTEYQTLCKVMLWLGRWPSTQAIWQGPFQEKNTQHNSTLVEHLIYLGESRRTTLRLWPPSLTEYSFQLGCYVGLYKTMLINFLIYNKSLLQKLITDLGKTSLILEWNSTLNMCMVNSNMEHKHVSHHSA